MTYDLGPTRNTALTPGELYTIAHPGSISGREAPLTPDQLRRLRSKPDMVRRISALLDAGERLIDYVEIMWHWLDPGVQFRRGWAIEAIAEHLEAVTRGQIKKLLINVPPGFSKSLLTCVYWPSWEWGPMGRPMERYVCTSYIEDLVIRDNVKCRQLMLTDDYQAAWGDIFTMSTDQNTKIRFGNNKTGWKAALSIDGLTGDRGSRFIFDDPQSVKGAASDQQAGTTLMQFAHAMPTRTQTADDPFIGIMQRLRQNDISGVILEHLGKSWEHLWIPMHFADGEKNRSRTALRFVDPRSIPGSSARGYFVVTRDENGNEVREWRDAYHEGKAKKGYLADPVRFPPSKIDDLEQTMSLVGGISAIKGQLENDPLEEGGEFFVGQWQPWSLPYPAGMTWIRCWDFASSTGAKNDWSVAWLWGRFPSWSPYKGLVVRHVYRFRALPGAVRARFIEIARADGPGVHIAVPKDPGPGGAWVVTDLTNALPGFDIWSERQDQHKTVRARPMSGWFGEGLLHYDVSLDKIQAEGMPDGTTIMKVIRDEWSAFDRGTFDDTVDAASIGMARLAELNFEDSASEPPEDHSLQSSFLAGDSVYADDIDLGPAGVGYLD